MITLVLLVKSGLGPVAPWGGPALSRNATADESLRYIIVRDIVLPIPHFSHKQKCPGQQALTADSVSLQLRR